MIRRLLYGVAALLLAHPAAAADGDVLRQEFDGGSWDFDLASVVIVNDTFRTSRMSLTLARPLQDQSGARYDHVEFLYEHDCKENRMRVAETLTYLAGERVEVSGASPDWRPAADSAAHKYACALVRRPAGD